MKGESFADGYERGESWMLVCCEEEFLRGRRGEGEARMSERTAEDEGNVGRSRNVMEVLFFSAGLGIY